MKRRYPRFTDAARPPPMPRKRRQAELPGASELYERLFAEQGGKCAIRGCNRTPKTRRFHIDHDHATGQVRGLLCHWHNRIMPKDSREAKALADYLAAHEGRVPPTKAEQARSFLVNEWRPVTKQVTRP